jgi:hypothetical protein
MLANTWTQMYSNNATSTTQPSPRTGMTAWTDGQGNAYIFGGRDNNGNSFNDLWKYSMTANSWTMVPSNSSSLPPSPRSGMVSWVALNVNQDHNKNYAYIFGDYALDDELWIYDMGANSWTKTAATPGQIPSSRYGEISWTDNQGNAYIYGGYDNTQYYSDLWKYNLAGGQWTQINPNGNSISILGAVAWVDNNDNAYIYGGYTNGNILSGLYQYNMTSNSLTALSTVNTPSARYLATAWVDSTGNAYLFGGTNDDLGNSVNDLLWKYGDSTTVKKKPTQAKAYNQSKTIKKTK